MTFAVLLSPSSFVAILHHIHWRIRWDSHLFARFSIALCTTKVCSNLSYSCNIFCSILHSFMIHIHYILNSVCDEYIWWAFSVEFAADCGLLWRIWRHWRHWCNLLCDVIFVGVSTLLLTLWNLSAMISPSWHMTVVL